MGVVPKKVEKQRTKSLLVFAAVTGQKSVVIVKGTDQTIRRNPLFVRTCLKTREDRRIPCLEEIDDQADPRI